MQDIDTRQISDFDKVLNDLLDEFPKMRRELHEELGELAKKEVDSAIPDSFTDENPGGGDKIRRWQKIYIGSGGRICRCAARWIEGRRRSWEKQRWCNHELSGRRT